MTGTIGAASIALSVDSSGVETGMRQADAAITRTGRSMATLGQAGRSNIDGVGAGAGAAATRIDAATRSMIGSIQRTAAVMDAGERGSRQYFEALASARGVDSNVLRPYLDQLEQVRARQAAAAEAARTTGAAFGGTAQSAAQMANNLREVPAQFTDIITSLQGGQRPLTVFMQQGGQLRDMFGSAGGAARALGGYVVSLINPFTVAAGAATLLAVAYNEGSKESDAYRKSLILTGNAAGTSSAQLAGMAAAISKQGVGTQAAAADALAQLAGTGKVGAENLQQFAATAVLAQKAIGTSVSDTVSAFAELGRSPLQASEKLNEQYHYLTLATYEQIKALTDQGKADEAAKVAQTAYADAITSRGKDIQANLGLLEKGWNAVGGAAKGAWDWMLNVGREDSFEQKLEKAQAALEKAQRARFTFAGGGADGKADLDAAQGKVDALLAQKDASERLAAIDAERIRFQEAGIAWDKEGEKFLTRREQLERDIEASRNRGLAAGASDTDIAARELEIRKQYSDIFNAGIDSQIEAIKRRGEVEDIVSARSMAALTANRDAGLATSLRAQEEYATAAEKFDIAQFAAQKSRLEQELALTKGKANSEKEQAALRGQIAQLDEQAISRRIALTNELFVLEVKSTRDAISASADLVDKRSEDLQALKKQVLVQQDANSMIGRSKEEIAAFNASLVEEVATRKEGDAAILDTILGREQEADALRASAAELRKLAAAQREGVAKTENFDLAKKQWESVDQTAHDVFVNIFNGGKNAFERLRDTLKSTLLDLLYQMTVKKWIFQIGANVTGFSGLGGTAAQANGLATSSSPASGAIGTAQSALSVYNLTAGAGTAITAAGNLFGSSAVSAFGAGLSGGAATADAAAAYAAAGQAGVAGGLTAGASVNAAIAAIPGWGWAALGAAAVASYLGVFSGGGPESDTRLKFTSNNTPGNISINERGNEGKTTPYIGGYGTSAFGTFGVSSTFWMDQGQQVVQQFIQTVSKTDDALAGFLTSTEKASVSSALTGHSITAHTGTEGSNPNANGQLDSVFTDRINTILNAVEPGLAALESGFSGTSQELATEAAALLQYRQSLKDSGQAVFGATVTLQQIAALKLPTEGVAAALSRVTAEFTATNQAATLLGKNGVDAFGAAGLASESARAQLLNFAGGAQQLTAQASSFAQNYLTDAERLAPVAKALDAAMASLGLSGITTRDQFKAVVQGLDLTTEAGNKELAQLLALADAFAQVHVASANLTKSEQEIADERKGLQGQYDELTMTQAQLAAKARNAIDAHNLALYDQVQAAQAAKDASMAAADASKAAADAIAKAQENAIATTRSFGDALANTITKAQDAAKALREMNDALLTGESSALSPEAKYAEAKRQFETASVDKLQSAEQTFLAASKAWNGGSAGYAADFNLVLNRNNAEAVRQDSIPQTMAAVWKIFQSQMGAHENGGVASGWSIVGEKGPEVVNFTQPARVYTASQSREIMGGGDSAAARESAGLLRELLVEARADKAQRAAVGAAQVEEMRRLHAEMAAMKRKLAAMEAA